MKAAEGEGKARGRRRRTRRDVEARDIVVDDEPRDDASAAGPEERGSRASGRAEFVERIDEALTEIEGLRQKAHYHDSEIERLSEETRRMIEEMQEELKAA
jgi:hypothetical protein